MPTGEFRFALGTLREQSMLPGLGAIRFNLDPMYDYMIGVNVKGALDASHGLGTSWEMSPDGKAWSFRFRSGVVFHNGDPATAHDVAYSLEWIRSEKSNAGLASALRALIDAVEVPDNTSMVIRLKRREIFFPISFMSPTGGGDQGFFYPKNYLSNVGPEAFNKKPVGSGPYRFKDNISGDRIVYEALDRHWYYGVPKYKVFTFWNIPDEAARVASLQTGNVQLAEVSRDGAKRAAGAGLLIKEKEAALTLHARLHDQWVPGNPLGNVKVRQALDLAIDRQVIVDTFLAGRATPSHRHVPSPIDLAYVPEAVPPQDLERARKLLKEAGYEGFTLNYLIHEITGVPEGQEIAEAIAVWWEQIGVKVKRTTLAYATVLEKWQARSFEIPTATCCPVRFNRPVDIRPPGSILDTESAFRLTHAPEMEGLAKELRGAPSLEEHIRLTREFGRKYTELALMPTIASLGELYAVRRGIGGETWDLGQGQSSIRVLELVRR